MTTYEKNVQIADLKCVWGEGGQPLQSGWPLSIRFFYATLNQYRKKYVIACHYQPPSEKQHQHCPCPKMAQ